MNLKIEKAEVKVDGTVETTNLTVKDMEWGGKAEAFLRDVYNIRKDVRVNYYAPMDAVPLTVFDGEVTAVDYNGEVLE